MHIVVISNNYPSNSHPNRGAFLYNLVQEISKTHTVTVIAPMKIKEFLKRNKGGSYGKENCTVLRPLYASFGNKRFLGVNFGKMSFFSLKLATELSFNQNIDKADVIYCHFLLNALAIHDVAKRRGIPLVVASGESQYQMLEIFGKKKMKQLFADISFIICVSSANFDYLSKAGYDQNRMLIVPNSVNYDVFKPLDKIIAKHSLGLKQDDFVIGFIGHFIHRKGPNRLIEAVDKIVDVEKLKVVLVGSGEPLPPRNFTRIVSPQPNGALPAIINAFDIFVLPTLAEGHCNVIEEVKACCIPIISSRGTTVEQQLSGGRGVLVDPTSVDEISSAIRELMENPDKRKEITEVLAAERNSYSLSDRADRICAVLKQVI